jgi:short subunit dehydrogenase-like uncharacterized protein
VESLGLGGRIRKNGKIVAVPFAYRTREIDLGEGVRETVCIPWGDVSTAFHTTGIPNVEVFLAGPNGTAKRLQQADTWGWILRNRVAQWVIKRQIARGPRGPDQTERDCNPTFVWGEVTNDEQQRKIARIRTANGYVVTVHASLAILSHILNKPELAGFFTPAKLMGPRFIESLPGSSALRIDAS